MKSSEQLALVGRASSAEFARGDDEIAEARAAAVKLGGLADDLKTISGDLGMEGDAADAAQEAFMLLVTRLRGHAKHCEASAAATTVAQGALRRAKDRYHALPSGEVDGLAKVVSTGLKVTGGPVGLVSGLAADKILGDKAEQEREDAAEDALVKLKSAMETAKSDLPRVRGTEEMESSSLTKPTGTHLGTGVGQTGGYTSSMGGASSSQSAGGGAGASTGAFGAGGGGAAGFAASGGGAGSADGSVSGTVTGAGIGGGLGSRGTGGVVAGGLAVGGLALGGAALARSRAAKAAKAAGGGTGGTLGRSSSGGGAGGSSLGGSSGAAGSRAGLASPLGEMRGGLGSGLSGVTGSQGAGVGSGPNGSGTGASGASGGSSAAGGQPMGGGGAGAAGGNGRRAGGGGYLAPRLDIADEQAIADLGPGARAGSRSELAARPVAPASEFEPDERW